MTALVDDEDYEFLNQFKWCVTINGKTMYAVRWENGRNIFMHTVVAERMGKPGKKDHTDRCGLNNTRGNLGDFDATKNQLNKDSEGVEIRKRSNGNTYRACLHFKGKKVLNKTFKTYEEAKQYYMSCN